MIKLHSQTLRTFFHSLGATAAITIAIAVSGHRLWAAGFLIGAFTSLFSLFSLKVCVPALFYKGASARASVLLQVVLLMKLPLYAIALFLATRLGSAAAFAAFGGCAIVPCVITLETVFKVLVDSVPAWKRAAAMRETAAILPEVEALSRRVADLKAEDREAQPGSHVRTVREGVA